MPEFGVPEGGTEVEGILEQRGGSKAGRILAYFGALLGTFVVLVGSALTVDLINRQDPRNEVDTLRTQAQEFRSDILAQRFAFQNAADSQRSASRLLIDLLNWADARYEQSEREKQALAHASDDYQGVLDNIRALLADAVQNFRLGSDSAHPENSQLGAFFAYQTLLQDQAKLFAGCLEVNVDNTRNRASANPTGAANSQTEDPDASAPEGEPRSYAPRVQCASVTSNSGVMHGAFVLDESALRALDDCETAFGRELVEATRILNQSASVNRSAADNLALVDRLSMEARRQKLWRGPQPSDWAEADDDLQRSCEPLRQYGAQPAAQ
jgi:hypothetical protein